MQGLARFSLVAVIVLAAILLGAWAYLTARYGSVEDFMASDDAPRYWQPIRSEAHQDQYSEEAEDPSAAERAAGEVRAGVRHPEESGEWRRVKPEPAANPDSAGNDAKEQAPVVEAVLKDIYSESSIEIEDEALSHSTRDHVLKPFFARTRPENVKDRIGYLSDERIELLSKPSQWNDELKKAMAASPVVMVRGVVEDKVRRKPLVNVVVAPVDRQTRQPSRTRAVTNESGRFLLMVPEAEIKSLARTGKDFERFELAVIADGYEPDGARKDSLIVNGFPATNGVEVRMDQGKGLRVRVTLSNQGISAKPTRIWAEFRASENGALFDDCIFMSVDAPASGSVVFRFPNLIGGAIRIGAGGDNCSSREVVEAVEARNGVLACTLRMTPTNTYYMRGSVAGRFGHKSGPTAAARIESLPYHDVTYTDENGLYEFSVRLDEKGQQNHIEISVLNQLVRQFPLDERQFPPKSKGGLQVIPLPETEEPFWVFVQPAMAVRASVEFSSGDRQWWENSMYRVFALREGEAPDEAESGSRSALNVAEFTGLDWGVDRIEIRDLNASKDRQLVASFRIKMSCWTNPRYAADGRTLILEVERLTAEDR